MYGPGYILLLVFTATHSVDSDASQNYFYLPKSEFELGIIECGEHLVDVAVVNQSKLNRRVLGVEAMCDLACCYGPADGDGTTIIDAGQTYKLAIQVLVKKPGPFVAPVTVYLEDKGTRRITVTITGMGVSDAISSAE